MVIQGASLMGAIFISNPNLRIADSIDTFYKILLTARNIASIKMETQ